MNFKSNDDSEVDVTITSITVNDDSSVVIVYQKVLEDNSDNNSENDGAPVTLTLSASDKNAASIVSAIQAAVLGDISSKEGLATTN